MKRYTHLPQVVLGAAFGWSVPMAFAAQLGEVPRAAWLVFVANLLWTIVYDTFYAMVDRDDDIRIGVKSTAILFGDDDKMILGALQVMTLLTLIFVGVQFNLAYWFYVALIGVAALFIYHQWLIRERRRDLCFKAFLDNNRVGALIFAGIFLHYLVGP
jgi:4-hydroxybenzoate polyprenyltransferase